jgi:hypothetical protein
MNNPTLGRSYTTRMSQADSDVPNRGVDVYSHPRRACYLQGSLSDSLNPHQRDIKVRYTRLSSLHSTLLRIQSAQHLLLTLYSRFLTGMS